MLNTRVKGTITISKEDTETGKKAQGEATLKGAVYGVYARNTIYDPADNSVKYNANDKAGKIMTVVGSMATNGLGPVGWWEIPGDYAEEPPVLQEEQEEE